MKNYKFFLAFILIGVLLLSGCWSNEKDLKFVCSDDVRFHIFNPIYSDDGICYDSRGSIDFAIFNQGDLNITGIVVEVIGPDGTKNITLKRIVRPTFSEGYMVNFGLDDIGGEVDRVQFYPMVEYFGNDSVCVINKQIVREIGVCYL